MPYISNTEQDRKEMLQKIGVSEFKELIADVPEKLQLNKLLDLEEAYSEIEITRKMTCLANKNKTTVTTNSFLGAGVYDHFVPAVVDHVISRPEFLTAYTPYQAEVSQGTLQYIYEYQTLICNLTGMEVANAGMYDGASAAAEAILMAVRKTRKNKAVIAGTINPDYVKVIKAYTEGIGVEIVVVNNKNGLVDAEDLKAKMDNDTACFLLQTPNFCGSLENPFEIEEIVHSFKKALYIVAVDPISLAVLNAPSEYKADIVIGEGQVLGNKPNFGGPLCGFFATHTSLARMMPGRIVGATKDVEGKKGYVLTLQAREQHIRRTKATSNICSNQSLAALAATVYMVTMGPEGLKEVAVQSTTKAHYLAEKLTAIDGVSLATDNPFFKEFAVKFDKPVKDVQKALLEKGIIAGTDLSKCGFENTLLIAVTEMKTKKQLDELVEAVKEVFNA